MIKIFILSSLIALCFTVSAAFISVGKKEKPGFYTIFCYFTGLIVVIIICLCLILLYKELC